MAHWTLAAQHPLTRRWCPDDESRLARLAEGHELDLLLATDNDVATRRARLAPSHEPQELLNRWLDISVELSVMLSIRFEGLDPTKPFVDASALSRPLLGSDLAALGIAAVEVFGSFDPRYLRIWSCAPTDAFVGTRRDRRFLAAPVRNLVANGREDIPAVLSLTAATDLAHWDAATAAYAAVDAEHPGHSEQAQLAGDLQESVDAGTLFDVLVDGSWAGWIGVTTETRSSLGLPCYEVVEIVLSPEYRGHGYGPHLTRLLAHELPDRDRILVGTIHASNRGALEAAHRVGRHDVGGWLQLPL